VDSLADYTGNGWDLSDATEVSDIIAAEFMAEPPAGKVRVAGGDGMPLWGDIPPLTKEEQTKVYEQERQKLRAVADDEIAWRQDAVDADIATDDESLMLTAWKKYRVMLMRVDVSAARVEWPLVPA